MGIDVDFNAGADAEASSDSGLINLFAKFTASVDSLATQVAKANRIEQAKLAHVPNTIPFSRVSQPSGTFDIQDFGGPQPGREWVVRLLVAVAQPLAANAALVTWYVGQNMPGPAPGMLPASMARWQFSSVPGLQNFTSDVIHIKFGEKLYAGLTGVPASSIIWLTAAINDELLYDTESRG
jgi:hypothetical protein